MRSPPAFKIDIVRIHFPPHALASLSFLSIFTKWGRADREEESRDKVVLLRLSCNSSVTYKDILLLSLPVHTISDSSGSNRHRKDCKAIHEPLYAVYMVIHLLPPCCASKSTSLKLDHKLQWNNSTRLGNSVSILFFMYAVLHRRPSSFKKGGEVTANGNIVAHEDTARYPAIMSVCHSLCMGHSTTAAAASKKRRRGGSWW